MFPSLFSYVFLSSLVIGFITIVYSAKNLILPILSWFCKPKFNWPNYVVVFSNLDMQLDWRSLLSGVNYYFTNTFPFRSYSSHCCNQVRNKKQPERGYMSPSLSYTVHHCEKVSWLFILHPVRKQSGMNGVTTFIFSLLTLGPRSWHSIAHIYGGFSCHD